MVRCSNPISYDHNLGIKVALVPLLKELPHELFTCTQEDKGTGLRKKA